MANAILYQRSPTTRNVDTGATTPQLLLQNYPDQCVEFALPDALLEKVHRSMKLNVKKIPAPNPDAIRKVSTQENGLLEWVWTLKMIFSNNTNGNQDISIIYAIINNSQIDSYHIYGNIGFYSPNAQRFNIDPNPFYGLTFDGIEDEREGRKNVYDMELTLALGGIFGGS